MLAGYLLYGIWALIVLIAWRIEKLKRGKNE